MKKKNLLLLVGLILLSLLLTSCRENRETVNVYNWGDYIDKDTILMFEEEYDIRVNYDNYATNEDLYVSLMQGSSEFDVVIPSDYMIERMISEDMLEKIDMENVPNFKYISDEFKGLDYDPNNEYSVAYMWGTVGIAYNKNMIYEEIDSWDILWDERYKDNIIMLNSQRDAFAVSLLRLGYSMNTRDYNELKEAKDELAKQKELVYAYQGDEVKDNMVAEEAALAVVWSGDAVAMAGENDDLAYVIPKEGTNLWFDSMVIPKGAPNKENAEKFINFMTRPDIAAMNAEYIEYSTPVAKARDLLDEDLRDSDIAYPELDEIGHYEIFKDPKDILRIYDELWTELMSE